MGLARHRLEQRVWRYIEGELYNYDTYCKALGDLREEILEGTPKPDNNGGSRGGPGDPTASKVMRLTTGAAILRMTRDLNAIDRALRRLTENHRAVFELKYRQGKPWEQVVMEMPCGRSTYFDLRREIIFMVAHELGFEVLD